MTDWRLSPAGMALIALTLGYGTLGAGAALAQPSAEDQTVPPITEPAPEAAPESGPGSGGDGRSSLGGTLPRSPAEEAAQRQARLDALFVELSQEGNPDWERVQQQIWLVWADSGSASMDLLLRRAARAMEASDYELALRYLDDLVRLAPDFAEGWNKRATVYFLLGEYGRSVADIQRTLALEPRHFGALSGLGIILERLGDKSGAMRAYRRGLELHPHLPGAVEAVERLAPDVDGRAL